MEGTAATSGRVYRGGEPVVVDNRTLVPISVAAGVILTMITGAFVIGGELKENRLQMEALHTQIDKLDQKIWGTPEMAKLMERLQRDNPSLKIPSVWDVREGQIRQMMNVQKHIAGDPMTLSRGE